MQKKKKWNGSIPALKTKQLTISSSELYEIDLVDLKKK